MSVKLVIGGGISSPSVIIWYFSLTARCSRSDISRMNRGGRQLMSAQLSERKDSSHTRS